MINYKPVFSFGSISPPQTQLRSKFGGLPWGFPVELWPSDDVVLWAQLVHDPPVIDLGGDYVLHLWHWIDGDAFDDPPNYEDNKKYATLLPRSAIGEGLTQPNFETELFGELFIDAWEEVEDNVPESWYPDFFTEDGYWGDSGLMQREGGDIFIGADLRTKFGGSPRWGGNHQFETSLGNYSYLLQTDGTFFVDGDLDHKQLGTKLMDENYELIGERSKPNAPLNIEKFKGGYEVVFAQFANGTAFVFLDKTVSPPIPRWNWET